MNCEYCGTLLRQGDLIHGIRYGTLTNSGFKAAQDSAVTVICGPCGDRLCRIVYGSHDTVKMDYPGMFKMYEELTTVMKNGYKFIQVIAALPQSELVTLQHVIRSCTPRT